MQAKRDSYIVRVANIVINQRGSVRVRWLRCPTRWPHRRLCCRTVVLDRRWISISGRELLTEYASNFFTQVR